MIVGECCIDFGEGEMRNAIANLFSIQSSLVPGYNPANGNAFTEDVGTSAMQSGSACNERTNVNRYCCGHKLSKFEGTDLYYSIAIDELDRGVSFER